MQAMRRQRSPKGSLRRSLQPFDLGEHHVTVGASIGIAVAPVDGSDPDQLMKNADLALYRAKREGRGAYRFFESEMDVRMQKRAHP